MEMSTQRSKKRTHSEAPGKECANPIFEKWIIEWRDDAVAKNSKVQYVYSKALASLRKYPLALESGRECHILEYFGPSLCEKIDKRIMKEPHLLPAGIAVSSAIDLGGVPKKLKSKAMTNSHGKNEHPTTSKNNASKRKYIPAFRSGAYALLVTLYKKGTTSNYRGYMLKSELQQEAQEHCDASMTSNPNGNYTAWNSMAGLVTKGLVMKKGNPAKYLLTVEGLELAAKLINADEPISSGQSQCDTDDTDDAEIEVTTPPTQRVRFEPDEFDVLLCVDTSETNAKSKKDEVLGELRNNGVALEVVRLSVGDFVWICRKSQGAGISRGSSVDMVLPYVVERKRSDDLASSIRDGRYHEQKHRLEQTGLQPIYLIESYGSGDFGLVDGALKQAVANTQVTNRFIIHETTSIKDTCAYLTQMTRHLSSMYKGNSVTSCTKEEWPNLKGKTDATYLLSFHDFNEFGTKSRNWTVSEMFARHLMKLRGLSADKAFAITQTYPTPADLMHAYRVCSSTKDQEKLLASIQFGISRRTVGPAISKVVHSLYTSSMLK